MADIKPPPMIFASVIILVLFIFLASFGWNWFWTSVVEGFNLEIGG